MSRDGGGRPSSLGAWVSVCCAAAAENRARSFVDSATVRSSSARASKDLSHRSRKNRAARSGGRIACRALRSACNDAGGASSVSPAACHSARRRAASSWTASLDGRRFEPEPSATADAARQGLGSAGGASR